MQGRHDRHGEPLQKLDDVSTGLAAENPILMLKANNVKRRCVQECGSLRIAVDGLVLDLEPHGRRIVIGTAGIVHGNDAGLQVRPGCRNRPMQVVGEGGDTAAAGKMIADERNALKWLHGVAPAGPCSGSAFV
jgi:hypothetical protein